MKKTFLLFLATFFICWSSSAQQKKVYQIDINTEIGSTSWVYLQEGLNEASRIGADLVVLHLNTYGGTVVHADSMRMAILNHPTPVVAFIDMNAASAGALISIACDSIYMRKGSSIGAATVVGQTGEAMPDKYQSYMRSTMRATAEAHGRDTLYINEGRDTIVQWKRDPRIAEAMVDERIYIEGIIDTGKVLTFTAEEALKHRFCEAIVENIPEIIETRFGYDDYSITLFKPSVWDSLKGFLTNPAFQAILILVIIGGIYFELQTPGIGFPLLASAIAAFLYFTPLFISGFAEYWEILLFIAGVGLLAVELFILPGFGVAGISGVIFILFGLTLSLIDNVGFEFEHVELSQISRAMLTVLAGLITASVLLIYLSNKIGKKGFLREMALNATMDKESGFEPMGASLNHLKGAVGTTATALRPSGKVLIEGERYDAVSMVGFIDANEPIKVTKVENAQLYVVKQ